MQFHITISQQEERTYIDIHSTEARIGIHDHSRQAEARTPYPTPPEVPTEVAAESMAEGCSEAAQAATAPARRKKATPAKRKRR